MPRDTQFSQPARSQLCEMSAAFVLAAKLRAGTQVRALFCGLRCSFCLCSARVVSCLEASPSPVYGARLLSGFGAQPHREFKSRRLRQTKKCPTSGHFSFAQIQGIRVLRASRRRQARQLVIRDVCIRDVCLPRARQSTQLVRENCA